MANPNKVESGSSGDNDDDDEFDEEDEDDEQPASKGPKLKIPSVAKLGCSMRSVINTKIKENNDEIVKTSILKIKDYTSPATLNVWYMFLELEYSFQLLCAGIELRHP